MFALRVAQHRKHVDDRGQQDTQQHRYAELHFALLHHLDPQHGNLPLDRGGVSGWRSGTAALRGGNVTHCLAPSGLLEKFVMSSAPSLPFWYVVVALPGVHVSPFMPKALF